MSVLWRTPEAQEALNAGEAFVNGLRDLAGNFNQLQGPQRTQAFDSLQRSYDTFIVFCVKKAIVPI